MFNRLLPFVLGAGFSALTGCAGSTVTPVAQNQFILSTSAAPVCGSLGASKIAAKMAAVETLRRGYPRFLIIGMAGQNNVHAVSTGPTYAQTQGIYNAYGSTVYGSSTTTFGGGGIALIGSHDSQLNVLMLKPGDRGYNHGLDAKLQLGAKWQEYVAKGVHTCTE